MKCVVGGLAARWFVEGEGLAANLNSFRCEMSHVLYGKPTPCGVT